jgi:hypothetical protein
MLQSAATPDPRKNTTHDAPDNPTPSHDDPAVRRQRCATASVEHHQQKRLGVRLFKD